MKSKRAMLLSILCIAGMCTGCVATGKWTLETTDPTAMRPEFRPHALTLQEDGTYYADTDEIASTGVWTWQGSKVDGLLVLDERDGVSESFKASMPNNLTLVLESDIDGRPVKGTYKRKD